MNNPEDKDSASCVWANTSKDASKCSKTRSPKNLRTGYVTAKEDAGSDIEAIAHRVGATPDVLIRHYEFPTFENEHKRF